MKDLCGHVLILTGPPGSGKSTAAASLVASSGIPAVHLHSDDFWHYIKSGFIEPYLPTAHRQNTTVVDVLAGAAERYAKGNYFVVVDGIIGPWFLDPFRSLSIPLHYIVLRPVLSDAIERCQQRGGDTLTDPGPISALHQQFSALNGLEQHVIETAGQNRADTLEAVHAALVKGNFRLQGADQ
ncbi:AAA domain-containing protein [Phyllobacterium myrsinacearum]|uniref:AAA family ATPase n=1 Tax=Phyllobacterium myrsinacearum TaxID=28101 RepID=UPI001029D852|nr:AAA family ATPase [Phyllobacterium myrsinacearum]RZS77868.1 AAA domain-containing protein [Phyllobacterium myrsinacearum]